MPVSESARMPVHTPLSDPPINLLDIAAVALRLSTTVKQVRNMVARAEFLAPIKIAGLGLRWVERAVDAWLADVVAVPRPRTPTKRPGPAARAAGRG